MTHPPIPQKTLKIDKISVKISKITGYPDFG